MDLSILLFLLCSLAGLIMVVGSLFLLWKGRIYLDNEGKNVSEFELPLGFRIKTQFPVLVMFLFGTFLMALPIYYNPRLCPDLPFHNKAPLEMVDLTGKINSPTTVKVLAVVAEQQANGEREIKLRVPYVENRPYRIRYECPSGSFLRDEPVEMSPKGEKQYPFQGFDGSGQVCGVDPQVVGKMAPAGEVSQFK